MPRQEVTASKSCCSGRALARPLGPARHPSGPTTPSGWHGDRAHAGLTHPPTLGQVSFLPSLLHALLALGPLPFSPQPSHK